MNPALSSLVEFVKQTNININFKSQIYKQELEELLQYYLKLFIID